MADDAFITSDDLGFSPDLERKLSAGIESGLLRDLHAVLVARSGRLALERYDEGHDENWGQPLGRVSFGPETLHDLRSVTKSVVGLLYGIALDRALCLPLTPRCWRNFPNMPTSWRSRNGKG